MIACTLLLVGIDGAAAAVLAVSDVASIVEERFELVMVVALFGFANVGVASGLLSPRVRALFQRRMVDSRGGSS